MSTFISYSRSDSSFAIKLAKDLKSAGFEVWLDQLDIPTGARWDDEVEAALESCKTFVIVLSPESIQSQNVKDEVGFAIDSGKDILPVRIKSGDIPFRLRRFQYVDFSKKSYPENLKEIKSLLSAMGHVPGARAGETELPVEEAAPTQKRMQAVTPASDPQPTTPLRRKTDRVAPARRPISRALLIGAAVVVIFALAGALLRTRGGERASTVTPSSAASNAENPPTAQLISQSTAAASQVTAPVETGQSEAFLTRFDGSRDLNDWDYFVLGMGRRNKIDAARDTAGLRLSLNDPDLRVYYLYGPGVYEDVVIRMKAENLGENSSKLSLVCRRIGDTWYEYSVLGGGLWQFYDYSDQYIPVVNGGTGAVLAGKAINEYEMRCIGSQISLHINGQEVAAHQIRKNAYTGGQVGFSVFSDATFPTVVQVTEYEISPQQ
jgi:hypothetical protein